MKDAQDCADQREAKSFNPNPGKRSLLFVSSKGRTPSAISVNKNQGLAWETGAWKGYDPGKGEEALVGGNYAAMWTRESGEWKIKSELFMSLE